MKSFTFNKVYIIRSIDPSDYNLNLPGQVLFDMLKKAGVPCELIDIHTGLVGFNQVILKITGDCITQDVKPILHFTCHGAEPSKKHPNGAMFLWDHLNGYSAYSWQTILPFLERLNIACQTNLFVSLCICHGFYSLLHLLDETYRIPFCGLLASPDPVYQQTAILAFGSFYLSLLSNQDVSTAIDDLRNSIATLKPWYDSHNIPMEEFLVLFSDDLFTKAAKEDFKKNRSTLFKLWQLGERLFGYIRNRNKRNGLISLYVRENLVRFPVIYKHLRDFKFMLDIYPQQRNVFDLPKNIKDLQN